jgi:uncharacterized repeat protein (TIGR01451 family)
MSLHGGLYKGQGRRLFASAAVVVLGLVLGAAPSVAGDAVPTLAAAHVTATVVPSTVTAGAICPTTGQVTPHFTPGGFEIDGNCPQDGGTTLDWNSTQVGTQPVANDGLLPGSDTTSFVASPGKSDVQYVYAYTHGDSTALWLDFAFTRPADTGSVAYELELNKVAGVQSIGDALFRITQNGNGDFELNSVQKWTASGWGTDLGTSGVAAAANAEGSFFEIALNLTTLIDLQPSCPPSTVFTALNMRTHTSPSQNSALADYIAPIAITPPSNCPNLTLNKTVVGGTAAAIDWTLTAHTTAAGVPAPFNTVSGTTPVTGPVVPTKAYALSESGPSGYTGSLWTCPGGTLSGSLGSQTVELDSTDVTCSITNTAETHLTLVKTVSNVFGGTSPVSAWTLTATGPTTITGHTTDAAVTSAVVAAGTYALTEDGPSGYVGTWSCTGGTFTAPAHVVLAQGQNATCTLNNVAQPAHLTLVKTVSNVFGGTSPVSAWMLTATGPTTITGHTTDAAVTSAVVAAGTYALTEDGPLGYVGTWSCTGGGTFTAPAQVVLALGQSATCTLNNVAQPAHLTLVKEVVNDHGGLEPVSAWTLTATGPTTITGITGAPAVTAAEVNAGSYALSESGPSGYVGTWSCTGGTFTAPAQVVLALGQSATCTISNVDQPAHLTLVKTVVNTQGGNALNTAWTLTATGPTTITGHTGTPAVTGVAVSVGTYTLSEADGPAGYSASAWVCSAGTLDGARLTLALNQSATCTITNTFVPPPPPVIPDVPSISLVKLATLGDTNGNGASDAGETITYSFLVTNTGNVALTTVAVADPKLDLLAGFSAVTCSPTTLLPAASVTCTAAAYPVTAADVKDGLNIVNEAIASGQPPTGSRVSATDDVSTPTAKPVVAPVVTPKPEVKGVVKNAPAPTTLAFTGAETVPLGLSGLLALVLGTVLTVASRRQGAKRQGAHRARE